MRNNVNKNGLIIPVYINEKIVLDMLAIMEDGFSTVSQVNYTEHIEKNSSKKLEAAASTSATILSKLLKIDVSGEISQIGNDGKDTNVVKEKVHTNDSLLSKFRNFLSDKKILKSELDFSKIGQFVKNYCEFAPDSVTAQIIGDFPHALENCNEMGGYAPALSDSDIEKIYKQRGDENIKD